MTLDFNGIVDAYTATIRRSLNNSEVEELQDLLKNPDKLDDLIKNQNQINLLPELRNDKLRLCRWFADLNMSMKPKFQELKETLTSDSAELRHLDYEVKRLKKDLDSASENRRLDVADSVLSVAISEAEEKSDALSDEFIAGRLPIDDFIKEFDESRRLYHMRKLKANKLAELLRYQY